MATRRKQEPPLAPRREPKPFVRAPCPNGAVVALARAFQKRADCGFALHDALLDAGRPDLADHFRDPAACKPGEGCSVVEFLLDPARFEPTAEVQGGAWHGHPNLLQFCLETHLAGAITIKAHYHGEGDSGSVDDYEITGPGLSEDFDWDRWAAGKHWKSHGWDARRVTHILDHLTDCYTPDGYENNEGGHGDFTINVKECMVERAHTYHEYVPVDDERDPEDEDYEVETVDGATGIEHWDLLHPEHVTELRSYDSVKDSNVGPGTIELVARGRGRSKKRVPAIRVYDANSRRIPRPHAMKEVQWAVTSDGRIYDPEGRREADLARRKGRK